MLGIATVTTATARTAVGINGKRWSELRRERLRCRLGVCLIAEGTESMVTCPSGHANSDGQRVCEECGAEIQLDTENGSDT
jgi:hypothetical protein